MPGSRSRKIKAISVISKTGEDGKHEYEIYLGTVSSEIYKFTMKEELAENEVEK
jgi:hypothetical protein